MNTLKEHYATRMKREIVDLVKENNKMFRAIWKDKEAIGIRMGVCPFDDLGGNEEGYYVHSVESLKKIIGDLPL